ncbi:interleukin-21 receptor-like [Hypanus sabinus]|uniref:interleukin-21 receptor-like n=1 Tax=Hypanus sabinus TaxID=79690 RepID=UPI0028C45E25|nr:interleukin-21 receptor-like [Hypanus sabinus]XP_059835675.1 interleukin-21 receptor-like [Hypanus sabinus]XP_059835676.1 interleukin-21 receptor-like [Hypanus sabinus]
MRCLWKSPQHIVLLLLLCGQAQCTTICDSLVCVTDYKDYITCTWRVDASRKPDVSYKLSAKTDGYSLSCNLNATECSNEGKAFAVCRCQLYEDFGITSVNYTMTITSKRRGVEISSAKCPDFDTSVNIKPIAPFNFTVSHIAPCETYNFTWKIAYNEQDYINQFEYQLRYRRLQDSWELQEDKTSDQTFLQLVALELAEDTEHVAQVRSQPAVDPMYKGNWSDWSPLLKFRTDVCKTNSKQLSLIPIVCGVLMVLFIFVVVMISKPNRLWKKLWIISPDPAPFFKPLFVEHGGNFTKWVNARYPDVLYEVSEKNAMVLEKGDAVQVYDKLSTLDKTSMMGLKSWEKQPDFHSSWQALGDPSTCTSAHSRGQFGNNVQKWKDKSYGRVSIDTVTVTNESNCSYCKYKSKPSKAPYMTQCNSNPARENSNVQDYPPTSHFFTHLHLFTSGVPPLCGDAAPRTDMLSLLRSSGALDGADGNVLGLQCLNIDWDPENETSSLNDEEASWADRNVGEGGSWSDGSLDAISSCSRPEPDLGYPKISLDLDTVDSGFTENDPYFMSTVDLACNNSMGADGADCGKESDDNTNSEELTQYYRSYVKQWVKSPDTSADCNTQE